VALSAWLSLPVARVEAAESPTFIDAEKRLRESFGPDLAARSPSQISLALVQMAEQLPVGGAIHLPESVPCGLLDFRRVADDVQITGGHGGTVVLGGGQKGIHLLFSRLNQVIDVGLARPNSARRPLLLVALDFKGVEMFDPKAAPASDLLALFCEGSIQIKQNVDRCAWIAGANAFGKKTVTASARVDHSLFLWLGINWPFADYNAHLDPKNKGKDWLDNAQLWFDCKGGGEGTRLYLMVETNYGNPGPGVVLKNCKGMALYHGSTERGSAQGPGIYWLKDCQGVQLGLRRVFSSVRQGARSAMPTHDITVAGGRGNILHNIEFFGNAQQETAVNTDPELQAWSNSFDFETKGFDGKGILRYCFTPELNRPEGKELEALKAKLPDLVKEKLAYLRLEPTEDNQKRLKESFLSGRGGWYGLNAKQEITFGYGSDDLTKNLEKLKDDRKLPPPPSVPATDAPRLRKPIAFTQQEGFGKAVLEAGADPTGKKPSDDAFAKVMYGMTRKEVQGWLGKTYQADADFRTARKTKDQAGMKAATARLDEAMLKLHPADPLDKVDPKKPHPARKVRRPMLQIPPGTFLLDHPLVLAGGWNTVWGAGPEKTTLKAVGNFKVIEQHEPGTLANFAVEGGKVGLAITGANHSDRVSPTLHSYIAGSNYYKLTFRNQTFSGIHVGNDDPELLGGAEHDQNKYVDLVFENTGLYGIFMNQNMLDKWLLLHSTFSGQKKAGVSVKFNNLIHGMVVGCKFKDIDGPGLDFMGGNPELRFRPHQVWVEQCDFDECGNEKEPAVDEGAGVCTAFTRCTIRTKGKKIKTGYRGGAAIYEDVTIDVKTKDLEPVMVLRGVRQNQGGRPNGHMLRNLKANGAVGFVNDANSYNDFFRKTCLDQGIDPNLNWDCNPAAHELAPPNGWVHPFVLYRCDFGGKRYAYTLLNVDTDRGKVLKEVDLSKLVR
jgi:hypothetical protein